MKYFKRKPNYYYAKKFGIKLSDPKIIENNSPIYVESPVKLGKIKVFTQNPLFIGAHTYIRSGELHNVKSIGRFCSIANNVVLGLSKHQHPINWISTSHQVCTDHNPISKPIVIGNDVWIGDGALIFDGVTISDGAIIGARSVVTKDVKPYEIVAGNPARSISFRFEDRICNNFLYSKWWEYQLNELKKLDYKNPNQFLNQLTDLRKAHYKKYSLSKNKIEILGA